MEAINKKQTFAHFSSTTSSPPSLAIHKDSHTISKANKPKIRIIHIFAPEIIKTDVANFRELVQRLTGKPTEKDCEKVKPRAIRSIIPSTRKEEEDQDQHDDQPENKAICPSKPLAKKLDMNMKTGFLGLDHIVRADHRIKEEENQVGMWINNGHDNENTNSGSGFLERFADLEGFIEELSGHEFPLFPNSLLNYPLEASNSHVQYGFGGPQLA